MATITNTVSVAVPVCAVTPKRCAHLLTDLPYKLCGRHSTLIATNSSLIYLPRLSQNKAASKCGGGARCQFRASSNPMRHGNFLSRCLANKIHICCTAASPLPQIYAVPTWAKTRPCLQPAVINAYATNRLTPHEHPNGDPTVPQLDINKAEIIPDGICLGRQNLIAIASSFSIFASAAGMAAITLGRWARRSQNRLK